MVSRYKNGDRLILKFFCILLLILLPACNMQQNVVDDISSYEPNMSEYLGLSDNKCFKGITVEELLKIFEEDKSAIIYMGFSACGNCQEAVPVMAKIAIEKKATIYYLDFYNDDYPISDENRLKLEENLNDYLMVDPSDGLKKIFTPHVFSIKDGNIINSQVGTLEQSELEKTYERIINDVY